MKAKSRIEPVKAGGQTKGICWRDGEVPLTKKRQQGSNRAPLGISNASTNRAENSSSFAEARQ
jgi:hypothetical protein